MGKTTRFSPEDDDVIDPPDYRVSRHDMARARRDMAEHILRITVAPKLVEVPSDIPHGWVPPKIGEEAYDENFVRESRLELIHDLSEQMPDVC